MSRKILSSIMVFIMAVSMLTGCQKQNDESEQSQEEVSLKIAGSTADFKAMEDVIQKFNEKYPNCTVEYEYMQDYSENITKRLVSDTDSIDLFLTNNLQKDAEYLPYALELYSAGVEVPDAHEGLVKNFTYINTDKTADEQIYAIPMGGEIRGMFVNTTLLDKFNLKVPNNRKELLEDCKVLSENGYIPLNANPGVFGQQLLYPYICNTIVNGGNYEEDYDKINNCEESVSKYFEDPMSFMYTLVENNYYNYKYVEEELGLFQHLTNVDRARDFLDIIENEDGDYEKKSDVGISAFMIATLSVSNSLEKLKEDYDSGIEYQFILSPVSEEDDGYAYMSPTEGIAINKQTKNVEWAVKFINFFFEKDNNVQFATENGVVPNTSDALDYMSEKFDIADEHVSQLGQVTFDYNFFQVINASLTEVSKANNPKYMKDGKEMYEFAYYMDRLEKRFEEVRTGSDILEDE